MTFSNAEGVICVSINQTLMLAIDLDHREEHAEQRRRQQQELLQEQTSAIQLRQAQRRQIEAADLS